MEKSLSDSLSWIYLRKCLFKYHSTRLISTSREGLMCDFCTSKDDMIAYDVDDIGAVGPTKFIAVTP